MYTLLRGLLHVSLAGGSVMATDALAAAAGTAWTTDAAPATAFVTGTATLIFDPSDTSSDAQSGSVALHSDAGGDAGPDSSGSVS